MNVIDGMIAENGQYTHHLMPGRPIRPLNHDDSNSDKTRPGISNHEDSPNSDAHHTPSSQGNQEPNLPRREDPSRLPNPVRPNNEDSARPSKADASSHGKPRPLPPILPAPGLKPRAPKPDRETIPRDPVFPTHELTMRPAPVRPSRPTRRPPNMLPSRFTTPSDQEVIPAKNHPLHNIDISNEDPNKGQHGVKPPKIPPMPASRPGQPGAGIIPIPSVHNPDLELEKTGPEMDDTTVKKIVRKILDTASDRVQHKSCMSMLGTLMETVMEVTSTKMKSKTEIMKSKVETYLKNIFREIIGESGDQGKGGEYERKKQSMQRLILLCSKFSEWKEPADKLIPMHANKIEHLSGRTNMQNILHHDRNDDMDEEDDSAKSDHVEGMMNFLNAVTDEKNNKVTALLCGESRRPAIKDDNVFPIDNHNDDVLGPDANIIGGGNRGTIGKGIGKGSRAMGQTGSRAGRLDPLSGFLIIGMTLITLILAPFGYK